MIPQLQEFSAGYSMIELATFPQEIEQPQINADLYDALQRSDPQAEQADSPPVLFRYQPHESHFRVSPSKSTPLDHIEIPGRMIEGMETSALPDILSYLVAKPRHAVRIARLDSLNETTIN